MNQKELAKKCNITAAMLSFILNGHRTPSWSVAKRLAKETGTNPALWMENDLKAKRKTLKGGIK